MIIPMDRMNAAQLTIKRRQQQKAHEAAIAAAQESVTSGAVPKVSVAPLKPYALSLMPP